MVSSQWTTERASFRYSYFQYGGPPDASSRAVLHDGLFHAVSERFEDLVRPAGRRVPLWAQDLLQISKAVHLADRMSKRDRAADGWTRRIDLAVQVVDNQPWEGDPLQDLHDLLGTMTGDHWQVTLWPGARAEGPPDALFADRSVREVALFSGGLDSTSYAAESVRTRGESPLFVTFAAPKLQAQQLRVFTKTTGGLTREERLKPISILVRGNDRSNRSRGLLFISTAVYTAATHRAERVMVPENGHLAVNPPLTTARLSACSTRSVHPRTLMLINRIIESVSDSGPRVVNPYIFLTKGQVCQRARDAGLTANDLADTVSCGSPSRQRDGFHCGHCFPCLVRRASLLASTGRDLTKYKRDFWTLPLDDSSSDDAYALHQWLHRPFTTHHLISDIRLPDDMKPVDLMPVLLKSRAELTLMIDELVPAGNPLRQGGVLADIRR